ncbi:MAG: OmpA family protein [Albidovulum sp.]|uniref:OmpA family protein n=1 Tax=Albidovulum sp. TaxID=1872424 RepID=UPI003C9F0A15
MNTTTALVASLSLMAPSPLWAQETVPEAEPEVALICPDGSDLPCPEGVEPIPAPTDDPEAAEAEAAEDAPAEADAAVEAPEAETGEADASTEMPEADTAEEADATAMEEPAVEAETGSDEAAEGEVASEEVVPAEPAGEETAEPTGDAAAEMTEEDPVVDEAAGQMAEEPAAADSTGDIETGAEVAPEGDEAVTEAEPAMDTETEAEAEPEADVVAEEVPDLPVQPDAASGEAPVAAAASAPEEAAVEAEVTEEVVTEETARSSDEDFANKVNEAAPKKKKKKKSASKDDDDDGLSDGEKAVLLGLGAVAVGALLSNNRKVELNSGDRVVVTRDDGSYQIIKDDNALLRQPGSTVRTETFSDGSTRTTVTRADGSKIVTIRDAEYRVLRRAHVAVDGTETLLIDDTAMVEPVDITRLPPPAEQPVFSAEADEAELRAALAREAALTRRFSLAQVRDIAQVRALVPVIDLNAITFETGSAAIRPDQAQSLARLGRLIQSYVDEDPREVFLIEGHTDAVGSAPYNLALSDRRAESVALALTEYFAVPPENMVVQGYGEEFLKIDTQDEERLNRRASVRRITDLLRQAAN